MLRSIVLAFGLVLLGAGLVDAVLGWPGMPSGGLIVTGALITLAVLLERRFYKPLDSSRPGPEWTRTEERFIDPETDKKVTVYTRTGTGERRYVAEE
jgi:hypothetical protein